MSYSKKKGSALALNIASFLFLFLMLTQLSAQDISVEVLDGDVLEETSNPGSFRIFITDGSFAGADITVNYAVAGTALATDDYTALSGSAVILNGNSDVVVDVSGVIDDNIVEGDETVIITLNSTNPVFPINATANTATITIIDQATEGGADGNFRFSLDKGKAAGVPLNATFTLNEGDPFIIARQIDLEAFSDAIIEGDETVILTLTGVDNPLFSIDPANNTATVTIIDTNTAGINIDTTTGTTTEAGGTTDFVFTLTSQPTADVVIPINGYDDTETSGPNQVVITPAEWDTGVTLTITGVDDTIIDGDIDDTINTGNPSSTDVNYDALVPPDVPQLSVTNQDDDQQISIGNRVISEGNSGTTDFIFTVSVDGGANAVGDINFTINTTPVQATSGVDYTPIVDGSGTILDGTNSATITVSVNGDTDIEPNEDFRVFISNSTNAIISDDNGLGRILNDDGDTISIDNISLAEGNSGTTDFIFTVSVDGGGVAANDIDFNFNTETTNTTATAGDDYVVINGASGTIIAGEASTTVVVSVNGDTDIEANETFRVRITNAINATISDV